MDRPRQKRKDPQRTGPIRNVGEAWREEEPLRESARRRGDASSSGVREGYRVIEEQIRRGRRMAQELGEDDLGPGPQRRPGPHRGPGPQRRPGPHRGPGPYHRPRSEDGCDEREGSWEGRGGFHLLGMPLRHLERLVREILRQVGSARPDPWRLAELLFRLQIEAISELARLGFGTLGMVAPRWGDSFEEDVDRVARDVDETLEEIEEEWEDLEEDEIEDERFDWTAAASVPTTVRSTVPIPVYIVAHDRTEVDLELPPGAQSLDLVVEPQVVTGTDQYPHPAFEAIFIPLAYGPVILRVEIPRDLPAGRYLRRILVRATGEPVGDLTVQVGVTPIIIVPQGGAVAKKARKR
jgi:hypothetical protein